MALTMMAKTKEGFAVADAYIRIEQVSIERKDRAVVNLNYYVSDLSQPSFDTRIISVPYDLEKQENIFTQSYKYLKTLPEFSNALDA